jgi:hypothetical protein
MRLHHHDWVVYAQKPFANYGDTLPFTLIFVVSGHSFAKRADLACLDVALGQVAFQARQAFDRPSVDVRWFGPW